MVTRPDLTADDLTTGIANAIQANDLGAVRDMLHALALIDPHRAQFIYDALTLDAS